MPFHNDDLLDVGAPAGGGTEADVGAEDKDPGEDALARLYLVRHEHRGVNVGQHGVDNAHAADCTGQHRVIKVNMRGHTVIDYPAMTIPDDFIVPNDENQSDAD
jgi:hypothetical protein